MKSDIEIARETSLKRIEEIAGSIGIPSEEIENYGKYIAKLPLSLINEEKMKKSNLILVTAITPTKAGIGKTTVSIGLTLGLNRIGKKAVVINHKPIDVRGFDCHEERLCNVVENNIEVTVDDIHALTNEKLREILPEFEEIPFEKIGLLK